jgi:hypothetical protein
MYYPKSIVLSLFLIFLLSSFGCQDQVIDTNPGAQGSVNVRIDHIFGNDAFALGSTYQLPNGEAIKGSILRYFISNIVLVHQNGSNYTIPQDDSYFLIDESIEASKILSLRSIPIGTYTAIHFTIGVDSLRSTIGLDKRKGVLDIGAAAQDMYWSWNSGYIHFKMEGTFSNPNGVNGDLRYHVGGFGGYSSPTINAIRTITLQMNDTPLIITDNAGKTIHINADIEKVFTGKTAFSIAEIPSVMFSDFSTTIADNYSTMFSVSHID